MAPHSVYKLLLCVYLVKLTVTRYKPEEIMPPAPHKLLDMKCFNVEGKDDGKRNWKSQLPKLGPYLS